MRSGHRGTKLRIWKRVLILGVALWKKPGWAFGGRKAPWVHQPEASVAKSGDRTRVPEGAQCATSLR
jgi:hypothetical protein